MDATTGAIGLRLGSKVVEPLIKQLFRGEQPGAGLVDRPVRISSLVSFAGEKRTLTEKDVNKLAKKLVDRAAEEAGPFHAISPNERSAVALALALTLRGLADLTMDDVQAVRLGHEELAGQLPDLSDTRWSGDAKLLYKRLKLVCCLHIINFFTKRSTFIARSQVEQTRQNDEIIQKLDLIIERLPSQSAADDAFEQLYRKYLVGRHSRLTIFGLDLGDQEWPLDDAYLSLETTERETPDGPSSPAPAPPPQRAEHALAGKERVLLRGVAGSGKTTLVQWLAVTTAAYRLSDCPPHLLGRVPFVLPMRTLTRGHRELPPPSGFVSAVGCPHTPPDGWIERVLSAGRGLLLVDGIDEIPEEQRDDTRRWLSELMREFLGNVCLVTARPSAVRERWLAAESFADLSLSPMSHNDIAAFVHRWHRAAGTGEEGARALLAAVRSRGDLDRLATNPLMCGLMCALHHVRHGYLPNGREALYGAALQMLLERRDQERKVRHPIRLDARCQTLLLQKLAYWLIRNGNSEMERDDAVHTIAQILPTMPQVAEQGSPEEIFRHLFNRSGLLREPEEGAIDFIHRTFQDYLAAREAVEARDFELLVRNAHLDQWEDVIRMAVAHGRPEERQRLLTKLIKRGDRVKKHRIRLHLLAMACLEHATQLDPETRKLVTERAEALLPPRTWDEAVSLAAAGPVVLQLLRGPEGLSDDETEAVVDTAALIGGAAAIAVLARFSEHDNKSVVRSLWQAWSRFDTDDYARAVVSRLPDTGHHATSIDHVPYLRGKHKPRLALRSCEELEKLRATEAERLHSLYLASASSLRPLRAMPALKTLHIQVGPDITDLSPLSELVIEDLTLGSVRELSDLTPLRELPLSRLSLQDLGKITDLTPLADMPLRQCSLSLGTSISDLTPLNRHRLQSLYLDSTRVEPLNTLEFVVPPESFELTLFEVASPFMQLSSALPVTALALYTDIHDFTGINSLSRLRDLNLLGALSPLTAHDWDQIEGARSVRSLTLWDDSLTSLHNSRAYLSSITQVNLHSTKVPDLAPLAEAFPKAEDVLVDCPNVVDVAPLANLPKLKRATVFAPAVLNAERLKALEGVELSLPPQSRY